MELQIMHAGISRSSPYFYNFCRLLENYPRINFSINPNITPESPKEEGILHFHRLKRYYNSKSQESAESFINNLKKAKERGWRVAWTIHNFYPIDREISSVDFWVTDQFGKLADIIFAHTDYMRINAENLFSKEVVNLAPVTHKLDGVFDENKIRISREEEDVVFAFAGTVAGYKLVPEDVDSFRRLKNKFRDRKLKFIIAGQILDGIRLQEHINGDPDISMYDFFIGDSAWRELSRTAEMFILSYDLALPAFRYGFYSSSIPKTASLRMPMIMPDCREIREFFPTNDMAIFYDFNDPEGITKAMEEGLNPSRRSQIRRSLEERANNFSWETAIKKIVRRYESLLGTKLETKHG
jgi:glycosyltransferase involved in cell wall biosynthesis